MTGLYGYGWGTGLVGCTGVLWVFRAFRLLRLIGVMASILRADNLYQIPEALSPKP